MDKIRAPKRAAAAAALKALSTPKRLRSERNNARSTVVKSSQPHSLRRPSHEALAVSQAIELSTFELELQVKEAIIPPADPALATRTQNIASSRNTNIRNLPTEMLELVLLKLGMEDILRSMSVCRDWNICIAKSTQLQVSLFLKPLKSKEAPDNQPNPLLLKIFPALFWSTGETAKTVNQIIDALPWSKNKQWSETIARPTASWRKMYTEQPPKDHVFEFEEKYGCLTPSNIPGNMGTLFFKIVRGLFLPNLGATYNKLCMEDDPNERRYWLYEGSVGEKVRLWQNFERVLSACHDTRGDLFGDRAETRG
jgi:hypothetical protein